MKKLLLYSLTLFLSSAYANAVTIVCGQSGGHYDPIECGRFSDGCPGYTVNHQYGFVEKVGTDPSNSETLSVDCTAISVKKGEFHSESISMDISGYGVGIRTSLVEGFMITCPLVIGVDRLKEHSFYGLKATAAFGVGASVGVFSNKRLGVCFLTGAESAAVGGSFSAAKMDFY